MVSIDAGALASSLAAGGEGFESRGQRGAMEAPDLGRIGGGHSVIEPLIGVDVEEWVRRLRVGLPGRDATVQVLGPCGLL